MNVIYITKILNNTNVSKAVFNKFLQLKLFLFNKATKSYF